MKIVKICVSQDILSVTSLRLVSFQKIAAMLNIQPMNGVFQVLQDMKFAFLIAVLKTLKFGVSTNAQLLLICLLIIFQLKVKIPLCLILVVLEMLAAQSKDNHG